MAELSSLADNGNSANARSLRAKAQLRDKFGRFKKYHHSADMIRDERGRFVGKAPKERPLEEEINKLVNDLPLTNPSDLEIKEFGRIIEDQLKAAEKSSFNLKAALIASIAGLAAFVSSRNSEGRERNLPQLVGNIIGAGIAIEDVLKGFGINLSELLSPSVTKLENVEITPTLKTDPIDGESLGKAIDSSANEFYKEKVQPWTNSILDSIRGLGSWIIPSAGAAELDIHKQRQITEEMIRDADQLAKGTLPSSSSSATLAAINSGMSSGFIGDMSSGLSSMQSGGRVSGSGGAPSGVSSGGRSSGKREANSARMTSGGGSSGPVIKGTAPTIDTSDKIGALQNTAPRPYVYDEKGIKGEFNYGVRGETGENISARSLASQGKVVTITTPSGKRVSVNKEVAPQFAGFLSELEARGYKINDLGGYVHRQNVNARGQFSMHAYGRAIDINAARNANKGHTTDMPEEVEALAAVYGLSWGRKFRDPMHFEVMSPQAATHYRKKLLREGYITQEEFDRLEKGDFSVRNKPTVKSATVQTASDEDVKATHIQNLKDLTEQGGNPFMRRPVARQERERDPMRVNAVKENYSPAYVVPPESKPKAPVLQKTSGQVLPQPLPAPSMHELGLEIGGPNSMTDVMSP